MKSDYNCVIEGHRPPQPGDGQASFGTPVPSPWGQERCVPLTAERGKEIMDDYSRAQGKKLEEWFGKEGVAALFSRARRSNQ